MTDRSSTSIRGAFAVPHYSLPLIAILLAACATARADVTFTPLQIPGSVPWDVSADGSVVAGTVSINPRFEVFRWTVAGTMFRPAVVQDRAALSADGSVVVGSYLTPMFGIEAFRWTEAGDFQGLGDLPGGPALPQSGGFGVSADGSVIVGYATTNDGDAAFRWTQATGMISLGDLAGGERESIARGVSPDGTVVVGQGTSTGDQQQAFRWTSQTGMVGLGFLPGAVGSAARAVSADGSVVVGANSFPTIPLGSQNLHTEASRWTAVGGMMSLGDLAGGRVKSEAYDVSADGSVIVGVGEISPDPVTFLPRDEAFYWTAETGMLSLRDVLVSAGVNLDGWRLTGAHGISHDGLTIVGSGIHNGTIEGWVATIPEPSTIVLAVLSATILLAVRLRKLLRKRCQNTCL